MTVAAPNPPPGELQGHVIAIAGVPLLADCDGVLYWPEHGLLAVADLHLEKGSSFARRGVMLPPYDTAATLARLARLIARYAPRCVVALGDSFHDGDGPARLADTDRDNLRGLQRGRDWIWIAGNHDPEPALNIGGTFHAAFSIDALTFRHRPTGAGSEISGHLHPAAWSPSRPHGQPALLRSRRNADGDAVLRGAYTGGPNVRDAA